MIRNFASSNTSSDTDSRLNVAAYAYVKQGKLMRVLPELVYERIQIKVKERIYP